MEHQIKVLADGTTTIERYPAGFPVDGDAMTRKGGRLNKKLQSRAKAVLLADPEALAAAKSWLALDRAAPGHEAMVDGKKAASLVNALYLGGLSAFLANHASIDTDEAATQAVAA